MVKRLSVCCQIGPKLAFLARTSIQGRPCWVRVSWSHVVRSGAFASRLPSGTSSSSRQAEDWAEWRPRPEPEIVHRWAQAVTRDNRSIAEGLKSSKCSSMLIVSSWLSLPSLCSEVLRDSCPPWVKQGDRNMYRPNTSISPAPRTTATHRVLPFLSGIGRPNNEEN